MNDIEQQRLHFESIALAYCQARRDPRHLYLKDIIWRSFFEQVPLPEKKEPLNILEAMCGYAEALSISQKYIAQDIIYSAFDYASTMVDYVCEEHPNIAVWRQDITSFRSPLAYDIIYIIGGVHHVHKYAGNVFENIAASLTPGGLFINFEPTHNNFLFSVVRKLIYAKNSFFDQETERGFSTSELTTLGLKNGLEPIYQLYPGLLAYVLWYNPDAFPLLNRGRLRVVRKIVDLESKLWKSQLARLFSFATLTCYRKKYE